MESGVRGLSGPPRAKAARGRLHLVERTALAAKPDQYISFPTHSKQRRAGTSRRRTPLQNLRGEETYCPKNFPPRPARGLELVETAAKKLPANFPHTHATPPRITFT